MFFKSNPDKRNIGWQRRRRIILSYLPDWVITIGLAILFFALDKVEGFRRDFSLSDTSLHYPYKEERISMTSLVLICFVAPFVLQPIVNLLTVRSWWDWHNSVLGLILALSTTGAITQITKITVGRPRPDMLSRCQPPPGLSNPEYGVVSSSICTSTNKDMMQEAFRAFPSGHSSLSAAGLSFLAFYLAGKLHLFDGKGYAAKSWIALAPLAGAVLVAITRTMDYRHHWLDVVTGSALGFALAYFSYRQYYPSLGIMDAHKPYSPRIKRQDTRTSSSNLAELPSREDATLPTTQVDHHADVDNVSNGTPQGYSKETIRR